MSLNNRKSATILLKKFAAVVYDLCPPGVHCLGARSMIQTIRKYCGDRPSWDCGALVSLLFKL